LLAAFTAGALCGFGGIRALGPRQILTPAIGFHIAQYGGATRANLLEVENSFQTAREDGQTRFEVCSFAGKSLVIGEPEYADACRRLYIEILPYVAYRWVEGFPRVFQAALGGFSGPGEVHGVPAEGRARVRFSAIEQLYPLLDSLTRLGPFLYWLGLLVVLLLSREPLTALGLGLFGFAHGAALLAVLPETKHTGPLLLPLAVFCGAGLAALLRPHRLLEACRSPRRRAFGLGLVATAIAFALVSGIAYLVSAGERRAYLAEIAGLPRSALDAAEERLSPARFEVRRRPGAGPDPVGYLLEIEGGPVPASAALRLRRGLDEETPKRLYVSRHPLAPRERQQVFFVCYQGLAIEDLRSVACALELPVGARLVSGQRVDLSSWRRPLFATAIGSSLSPGPPRLPQGTLSTEFRLVTPAESEAEAGPFP
jgi:hypothetical protein